MVRNAKELLDQLRDALQGPQLGPVTVMTGPLDKLGFQPLKLRLRKLRLATARWARDQGLLSALFPLAAPDANRFVTDIQTLGDLPDRLTGREPVRCLLSQLPPFGLPASRILRWCSHVRLRSTNLRKSLLLGKVH